jgi:hypothetical protein
LEWKRICSAFLLFGYIRIAVGDLVNRGDVIPWRGLTLPYMSDCLGTWSSYVICRGIFVFSGLKEFRSKILVCDYFVQLWNKMQNINKPLIMLILKIFWQKYGTNIFLLLWFIRKKDLIIESGKRIYKTLIILMKDIFKNCLHRHFPCKSTIYGKQSGSEKNHEILSSSL